MVTDYLLKEIPQLNPHSYEYLEFWKYQKRAIIEGVWSSGIWIPPQIYHFGNFHRMKINRKGTKQQTISKPMVRDIDWEKIYLYNEARGFSGFSEDTEFSCDERLIKGNLEDELYALSLNDIGKNIAKQLYKPDGTLKTYIPAREYLPKRHKTSLGKPLYYNDNYNILDFEGRGIGKSYLAACVAVNNFITDGATDYDEYLQRKNSDEKLSSETLIGAIDTKYSGVLVSAIYLGLDEMPGGQMYNKDFYPCPLLQTYRGSLAKSGDFIEASYDEKVGEGNWVTKGSFSKIHHRSFYDNPVAGNGLSPNLVMLEEAGFFYNLKATLGAIKDTTERGGTSFGTTWIFGTGGENESGSINDAEEIFFAPENYKCLAFHDEYEGRKKKIAYFVPAWKKYNDLRAENGVLNEELAKKRYLEEKKKEEVSEDKGKLLSFLANNPSVPSEVFIVAEGGFFPIEYLKEHKAELLLNPELYFEKSLKGFFDYNEEQEKFEFKTSVDAKPIREYNAKTKQEGCVEIFEYPIMDNLGNIEPLRYIAGSDQTHMDKSTTTSINSFFIFDRLNRRIVLEYTGSPERNQFFWEQMRRALLYYNATLMYERSTTNIYQYFEGTKSLYLLADTPYDLRDPGTYKEGSDTSKGFPPSPQNVRRALEALRELLIEPLNDSTGRLVLNLIKSPVVVEELIRFNPKGNFDRVSALRTLAYYAQSIDKFYIQAIEQSGNKPVKKSKYFEKFKREK